MSGDGGGDGLIIPDNIPGKDLDAEHVIAAAKILGDTGTVLTIQAATVSTIWVGLTAVYQAPTAPAVHPAMKPAVTDTTSFANKLAGAKTALDTYAGQIPTIKTGFDTIRTDAETFLTDFDTENRVWVDAARTKKYEFDGKVGYGPNGRGAMTTEEATAAGITDPVTYLRNKGETVRRSGNAIQIRVDWKESSAHVDQNNRLMDRVADQVGKLQQAQAECVNTINRLRDHKTTPMKAIQPWQLKQEGDALANLPWGHRVDEDRNCGEGLYHGIGTHIGDALAGIASLATYNEAKGWEGWLARLGTLGTILDRHRTRHRRPHLGHEPHHHRARPRPRILARPIPRSQQEHRRDAQRHHRLGPLGKEPRRRRRQSHRRHRRHHRWPQDHPQTPQNHPQTPQTLPPQSTRPRRQGSQWYQRGSQSTRKYPRSDSGRR